MKRDYRNFEYTNENYLIFRTIETFSRTASGKSWKNKPDKVKNEIIIVGRLFPIMPRATCLQRSQPFHPIGKQRK